MKFQNSHGIGRPVTADFAVGLNELARNHPYIYKSEIFSLGPKSTVPRRCQCQVYVVAFICPTIIKSWTNHIQVDHAGCLRFLLDTIEVGQLVGRFVGIDSHALHSCPCCTYNIMKWEKYRRFVPLSRRYKS